MTPTTRPGEPPPVGTTAFGGTPATGGTPPPGGIVAPSPTPTPAPGATAEPDRTVLLVVHTGREAAVDVAREASRLLADAGVGVRAVAEEAEAIGLPEEDWIDDGEDPAAGCELTVVVGGDGSILRGADVSRASNTPILGVNLGHVGFLAEAEPEDLAKVVSSVVARSYAVEERMTLDVRVVSDGVELMRTWAINEASVEKASRQRMLDCVVEVDARPLSRFGCDGVVVATPTGSTAYAFSAGGPVVWPDVEAVLCVPISAHALFSRPLVIAPECVVAVEVQHTGSSGVLWCDGRRAMELPVGARIEATRGDQPVRLARLHDAPFTDRLVAKFGLPVQGWRGRTSGAAEVG